MLTEQPKEKQPLVLPDEEDEANFVIPAQSTDDSAPPPLESLEGEQDKGGALVVDGLTWFVTDEDLVEYFSAFGSVEKVKILTSFPNGISTGTALIRFSKGENCQEALAPGKAAKIKEVPVKLNLLDPRDMRFSEETSITDLDLYEMGLRPKPSMLLGQVPRYSYPPTAVYPGYIPAGPWTPGMQYPSSSRRKHRSRSRSPRRKRSRSRSRSRSRNTRSRSPRRSSGSKHSSRKNDDSNRSRSPSRRKDSRRRSRSRSRSHSKYSSSRRGSSRRSRSPVRTSSSSKKGHSRRSRSRSSERKRKRSSSPSRSRSHRSDFSKLSSSHEHKNKTKDDSGRNSAEAHNESMKQTSSCSRENQDSKPKRYYCLILLSNECQVIRSHKSLILAKSDH